jgi:hypothetical protein
MQEELVSFETAKLGKEKGFVNILCHYRYWDDSTKELTNEELFGIPNNNESFFEAPTQSLLQKWLREVHNIDVWVNKIGSTNEKKYYFNVMVNNKFVNTTNSNSKTFLKYEEALEVGLQEALNLIEIVKKK